MEFEEEDFSQEEDLVVLQKKARINQEYLRWISSKDAESKLTKDQCDILLSKARKKAAALIQRRNFIIKSKEDEEAKKTFQETEKAIMPILTPFRSIVEELKKLGFLIESNRAKLQSDRDTSPCLVAMERFVRASLEIASKVPVPTLDS